MARSWPFPPGYPTLHLIGDTHFGEAGLAEVWKITDVRAQKALEDIEHARMRNVVAHVHVGDVASVGTAGDDVVGKAWLDQLSRPYHVVPGNHDYFDPGRTAQDFCDSWGLESVNYTVDFGFVQMICASLHYQEIELSQDTLTWLDAQLAAATKDCLIVCHGPLYNTVVGPTSGADAQWTSTEAGMFVEPDSDIRALLSDHSRAKAWICGHSHSPIHATGFVKVEDVGARSIISINASALYYTGRTNEKVADPLRTLYLTWRGDAIDIRYRDHGRRSWVAPSPGERVTTLEIPA